MQAFLQAAVVVEKTPATLFDDLAIAIDRTGPSTDAKDALAGEYGTFCFFWRSGWFSRGVAGSKQVINRFLGVLRQRLQALGLSSSPSRVRSGQGRALRHRWPGAPGSGGP